ncbi:MAG: dockerin type I repeat-containing protein [Candidatus Fimenecus sp.]
MKKSTKLLSVILAIVMLFSCMSVMASAYDAYDDSREANYTSNDTGLATLLTDEARASWVCDLVDNLLAGANIYQDVTVAVVDLRSIDALGSTLNQSIALLFGTKLYKALGTVNTFYNIGVIKDLDFEALAGMNRAKDTDVGIIQKLLAFLDKNAGTIGGWMQTGITLGKIDSMIGIDLKTMTADIPDLLKGMIYGLGVRHITNNIGDDPDFPNDAAWADLASGAKPTLDTIVQNLLVGILTKPRNTTKITDPSQNLICQNPEAYGATAAMIHSEPADDGSGDTWYYIYGVQGTDGSWTFSENTTLAEADKQYITHWDTNSCLLKNFDTSILNFSGKSLYQMLGDALPWAYDTFGAPNLDGQLRATIMQFCGAINRAETDTAITDQLKAKVLAYQDIEDKNGANGKGMLSDAMEAKVGEAGNYNFQYISLSGANINTMPDDLYYVVQWGNGWEFYHVDFTQMAGEKLELFKMLNWEWQAPAWSEIMPALDSTADSYLRNITDAIGKILDKAVVNLTWTYDSASEDNAHFEANIMGLVRKVLKAAPELIYGKNDAYKAKAIDTQSDEQVIATLGVDIIEWLMPSMVMPANVDCLEAIVVYGVREFIAEILPEYNWDDKIAAASTDADYLNIALDMGASIGVYYLKNVMALGTTTDGNGNTSYASPDQYIAPSADCATGWNTKLSYVIDQVLAMWLPDLSSKLIARNSTVFNSNDGMDKLSIIFNALFPGLLSLISGCSATIGDGTNKDCVVDLKQVKNLLAGILNLQIEPIAAKLYRNGTGYANKSLYAAVVGILKDLVCGIGFNDSPDYAQLAATLDTAVASSTPLDTLVSKSSLENLVKNLLWVISDTETKTFWPNNALLLVMQLTGQMDDMAFESISQRVDSPVYRGASPATVTPTVTLNTKGIRSSFYTNGYKSGNFVQDGVYSGTLTKMELLDVEGNVLETKTLNVTLTANTAYSGTSFSCPAEDAAALYSIKSYVTVTLPDGSLMNGGTPVVTETKFITTSNATTDDNGAPIVRAEPRTTQLKMWNLYIDENTPLSAAGDFEMEYYNACKADSLTNYAHRLFYIAGYGSTDSDGAGGYSVSGYTSGKAVWNQTSINGTTASYQANEQRVPFYWIWNNRQSSTDLEGGKSATEKQWVVDTKNFTRDSYSDDIVTLEFTSNGWNCSYKNYSSSGWKNEGFSLTSNPYIVIYNSYGLDGMVQKEVNSGKQQEDYTEASWATYINALKAAIAEVYVAKKAETFIADHSTNGVSDFKTCSENLQAAIDGLVPVTESVSTATDYTEEEKVALANLKDTLDAQRAKENLNNKNYIMYRWLKYYNEYAWLNGVYNNAQIPSGVADSKLTGVPSDKITAAIAAAPGNKQGALNAMVVAPTAEESAAAAKARADFIENLPTIDVASIQVDMAQMAQYETRLIAREASTYYLVDAYNMVKDITDSSAYTAESWAKFNTARTAAYNVAADATATPAEIHEARYDLLVAYKGLIAAGTDVDLTALEDVMAYVDTICANPTLFAPTTESGYATLDEALAAVFAEAGVKVTVDDDTYYIGGGDTGAAWLDEAGMRTAVEAQETVDRVVKEIKAELANIESTIKVIPDESVADNTTAVDYANLVVDGIKPGTINTTAELLALVKTTAPEGYTANLAVTASAANGFGTGTKVVLTVDGIDGFAINHTVMVYGDVNGDGAIDAFDAALINMNVSGAATLSGDFATAGDTTADGAITAADYSAVAAYAVGNGSIAQTR